MKLILHIGLPKTGTTTIQNHFLKMQPGYLGKYRGIKGIEKEIIKDFRKVCRECRLFSRKIIKKKTTEVIKKILAWHKNNGSPVILSVEGLWGGDIRMLRGWHDKDKIGYPPIVTFIKEFLIPAIKSQSNIKYKIEIIVTLRNQTDWLASRYAQSAKYRRNPCQKDFQKQVEELIMNKDPYADWNLMISNLDLILGRENVTVLLFEEMDKREYWEIFAKAIGLDSAESYSSLWSNNAPKENIKTLNKNRWQIEKSLPERISLSNAISDRIIKKNIFSKFLLKLISKSVDPFLSPLLRKISEKNRDEYIQLSDSLRRKVKAYYSESNHLLAKRLEKRLDIYGY